MSEIFDNSDPTGDDPVAVLQQEAAHTPQVRIMRRLSIFFSCGAAHTFILNPEDVFLDLRTPPANWNVKTQGPWTEVPRFVIIKATAGRLKESSQEILLAHVAYHGYMEYEEKVEPRELKPPMVFKGGQRPSTASPGSLGNQPPVRLPPER